MKVTVSVSALVAMVFGLAGVIAVGLVTAGIAVEGAAKWGFVSLFIATVAAVDCRLESTVERVVERHVGGLVERELAAFHLGRSRQ